MLWNLLLKDLKRVRHSPWPYVINLALPLCITALIGMVFGSSSHGGGLGQIKVAVVDQDDSVLGRFLRSAMSQGDARKYLSLSFPGEQEALRQINANQLSAVLIIPKGFTRAYLKADRQAVLKLVKNPAESFYPAIVEEVMKVLVTALNGVSQNLHEELPAWLELVDQTGQTDMRAIAPLLTRMGGKLDRARPYLFPPLVTYSKEVRAKEKAADQGAAANIFGYLLPGLAAMFLLFLADNAIRDLYREVRLRTFDRFRTVRYYVFPFILSKVLLAMAVLILGSLILFGGGGLIFGIAWSRPLPMIVLVVAFALCAAGFMAFLAALARTERRADMLNSVVVLLLSFVGGSFFPARQLPALLRDHLSPLMPNYWFIESIRSLQSGDASSWLAVGIRLAGVGLVLMVLASTLFQRMLGKGIRA